MGMRRGQAMRINWVALLVVLACVVSARPAAAVSVHDLVELTHAGLGDEVLVALVETSGKVYSLTPSDIVELKRAGVSERVIVVMLRQGRTIQTPAGPSASPAQSVALSPDFGAEPWRADMAGVVSPATVVVQAPAPTVVVVPSVATAFPFFPSVGFPGHFVPSVGFPGHVRTLVTTSFDHPGGFGRFMNDGFRTGIPLNSVTTIATTRPPRGRKSSK